MSLMTVPNLLSISRIPLGFFLAFSLHSMPMFWLLLIFCFAALSDGFDVWLARKKALVSPLGTIIDHCSDAIFVTAVISGLALEGVVPWLLPILIGVSFVQYVLDYRLLHLAGVRSSSIGRFNGIAFYCFGGVGIAVASGGQSFIADDVFHGIAVILILTTLASIIERIRFVLKR